MWLLVGDPVLGLVSFVLIRWRHRQPGAGRASCCGSSPSSPRRAPGRRRGSSARSPRTAGGGCWRSWRRSTCSAGRRAGADRARPQDTLPLWASIAFGCLVAGILVATGYAMGSQRQLVDSYRDRAVTAEREQRPASRRPGPPSAPASRARCTTCSPTGSRWWRCTPARWSYRTDLSDEERARAARSIEDNAHRALSDLRAVLGVLRDPPAAGRRRPRAAAARARRPRRAGGGGGGRRDARTPGQPRRRECPPPRAARPTGSSRRR